MKKNKKIKKLTKALKEINRKYTQIFFENNDLRIQLDWLKTPSISSSNLNTKVNCDCNCDNKTVITSPISSGEIVVDEEGNNESN